MRKHKVYSVHGCNNCPDPSPHPDDYCEDIDCDYLLPDGGCDKGKTPYECLEEDGAKAKDGAEEWKIQQELEKRGLA